LGLGKFLQVKLFILRKKDPYLFEAQNFFKLFWHLRGFKGFTGTRFLDLPESPNLGFGLTLPGIRVLEVIPSLLGGSRNPFEGLLGAILVARSHTAREAPRETTLSWKGQYTILS